LWVSIDFKLNNGSYIVAPVGKGVSVAPSFAWKNAKVIRTVWPESSKLPPDNVYSGYKRDFSVLFSVLPIDRNSPISCDVFYVVCDNACRPVQENLVVKYDGLLNQDEIRNAIGMSSINFLLVLCMAFLGGIILNCMPCVFPVLSLKIFSVLKNRTSLKEQGLYFAGGVIATFLSIGTLILNARRFGETLGWGFYMQNPIFVACLLLIFLMCALYFFGLYNISNFVFLTQNKPKARSLSIQSFLNGVFTSIASGVCVGPFVGIAIGLALVYNNIFMSYLVFIALGLGVAFPFSLVCFIPFFGKFLPKPGSWMVIFKEFMGFLMIFSCVWTIWILSSQINIQKLIITITSVIVFAMFIWSLKYFKKTSIVGIIVSVFFVFVQVHEQKLSENIEWKKFSFKELEEAQQKHLPIFLNFTAAWCLTCSVNDIALNDERVVEAFRKHNIQAIKADWTLKDAPISNILNTFGSNSVPFNVYYKPNSNKPIILPPILSPSKIVEIVEHQ
jgi:thiol:disulfide interchange protein DsbD